jgi:hypothetical protein
MERKSKGQEEVDKLLREAAEARALASGLHSSARSDLENYARQLETDAQAIVTAQAKADERATKGRSTTQVF